MVGITGSLRLWMWPSEVYEYYLTFLTVNKNLQFSTACLPEP